MKVAYAVATQGIAGKIITSHEFKKHFPHRSTANLNIFKMPDETVPFRSGFYVVNKKD